MVQCLSCKIAFRTDENGVNSSTEKWNTRQAKAFAKTSTTQHNTTQSNEPLPKHTPSDAPVSLSFQPYEVKIIKEALESLASTELSRGAWEKQKCGQYYYLPSREVKRIRFIERSIERQLSSSVSDEPIPLEQPHTKHNHKHNHGT